MGKHRLLAQLIDRMGGFKIHLESTRRVNQTRERSGEKYQPGRKSYEITQLSWHMLRQVETSCPCRNQHFLKACLAIEVECRCWTCQYVNMSIMTLRRLSKQISRSMFTLWARNLHLRSSSVFLASVFSLKHLFHDTQGWIGWRSQPQHPNSDSATVHRCAANLEMQTRDARGGNTRQLGNPRFHMVPHGSTSFLTCFPQPITVDWQRKSWHHWTVRISVSEYVRVIHLLV